ncbi:MAG: formate/nitrite transporter family protein [Phocaeicola sp.]
MLLPKEIVAYASKSALEKGKYNLRKTLILSFLAGVYIAMGALLSVVVGYGFPQLSEANPALTKLLMGITFPLGLILVVLAGGELFTGNCAYFIPSVMSKEQPWKRALRNWSLVWSGNFIGVLFFAYFLVSIPGLLHYEPWHTGIQKIAIAKTSNPFLVTFLKGVGANWMVCLAMWLGMSAKDTTGKIVGIWWVVMAFVTLGYEHCIANMFFIPMAMLEGAEISLSTMFIKNLIPSTLGNIIGGALFVGGLYWYSFEKLGEKK